MTKPCPVSIRGVVYRSQRAAARALGVHYGTIFQALERGRLDLVGLGQWGRPGVPIRMNGQIWPSHRAAARGLGVCTSTICKAVAEGRKTVRAKHKQGTAPCTGF